MKKQFLLITTLLLLVGTVSFAQEEPMDPIYQLYQPGKKVNFYPFYVYNDGDYSDNHYSPTGKMGDFKDFTMDPYYRENPFSGKTCIKIVYINSNSKEAGWAGLYWLDPQNNWGDEHGGYDLRDADELTFWAKGEKGGEEISLFQIGGIIGDYRDVGTRSIGPIILSREWTRHTINLKEISKKLFVSGGEPYWVFRMQPLSRIIGGFCWVVNMINDENITFYLDEIKYEQINSDIRAKK